MIEKRRVIKALPSGWVLRKNCDVQDGSEYGYRWAVLNECRQVIFVGKTLDRIYEKLEDVGVKDYIDEFYVRL